MKLFLTISLLFLFNQIFANEHPVTIQITKQNEGVYALRVQVPSGFGIQREAPNRILLSTDGDLKITKADLIFRGKPMSEKKEYFRVVEDMKLNLSGKGKLNINAKIFYCDFSKNICIPGQVQTSGEIN
ncbi:MAG: hypothetical protein K8R21_02590 [Leptospira sp.]|nr:hypothetical protein [Leptospira sp.]